MNTKTTKTTYSSALTFVLDNYAKEIPTEIADKLTALRESIDNKNAKRSTTLTPKQKENEQYKAQIVAILSAEPDKLFSVAEIRKNLKPLTEGESLSPQRVSPMCVQLAGDGLIKATKEKRQSLYSAITE